MHAGAINSSACSLCFAGTFSSVSGAWSVQPAEDSRTRVLRGILTFCCVIGQPVKLLWLYFARLKWSPTPKEFALSRCDELQRLLQLLSGGVLERARSQPARLMMSPVRTKLFVLTYLNAVSLSPGLFSSAQSCSPLHWSWGPSATKKTSCRSLLMLSLSSCDILNCRRWETEHTLVACYRTIFRWLLGHWFLNSSRTVISHSKSLSPIPA